jgi:hypothetical protein
LENSEERTPFENSKEIRPELNSNYKFIVTEAYPLERRW